MITKNEEGLKYILNLLNKLKGHNETFYSNTLKYFYRDHPPFENSLIYYHPEDNFFRFILRSKITSPIRSWDAFSDTETSFIRVNKVAIESVSPHLLIVSNANWLLDNNIPDPAMHFHKYMTELCKEEIQTYKDILIKETEFKPKSKPLF